MYSEFGQKYCTCRLKKECLLETSEMGLGKYVKDLNCNSNNNEKSDVVKDEILAIRSRFPTKVPVIVKRFSREKHLPQLDKTKYLVPQEVTMSQFQMILRNKMQLHPNRSMYLLVNERSMLSLSTTVAEVYYEHAQSDGYLYVTYASQEVFGAYEKEEILAIRSRFPTKVPVIVRKFTWDKELPLLDKSKFLVPQDITMSQFQMIIRNRMQLHPNKALYLLVNDRSLISSSMTVAQVYKEFGEQDGYLYVTYASQESFGGGTTSDPKENFNQ
ncbi:uncharacterized protein LOC123319974 [Coccinella septempunctata]|uniref:uncharacterized protein LOC123319974 n=1 Tax=Coccinella septempunctata TaxID=41139 RepID=UPI001D074A74|nr:uncharacterized protein LOC123319974 [Coccinella septempunctata]